MCKQGEQQPIEYTVCINIYTNQNSIIAVYFNQLLTENQWQIFFNNKMNLFIFPKRPEFREFYANIPTIL